MVLSITDYGPGFTTMADNSATAGQSAERGNASHTGKDQGHTNWDHEVYTRPPTNANQTENGAGQSILQCCRKSTQLSHWHTIICSRLSDPPPHPTEKHSHWHTIICSQLSASPPPHPQSHRNSHWHWHTSICSHLSDTPTHPPHPKETVTDTDIPSSALDFLTPTPQSHRDTVTHTDTNIPASAHLIPHPHTEKITHTDTNIPTSAHLSNNPPPSTHTQNNSHWH